MLKTEMRKKKTTHFSTMDTEKMLNVMHEENKNAVNAVGAVMEQIAQSVDAVSDAFGRGGRLFYIGCGTSGRLGVVDAAECPPTFGVSNSMVIGIIAGGLERMAIAGESEEDNGKAGETDLASYDIHSEDIVVGLSVSGNAAYVNEAIRYAKNRGCITVGITSNDSSILAKIVDIPVCPDTGAEVVTGSTRLKAGTAQKLILNMISTCAMTKQGFVYENLMINLSPNNKKLRQRAINIVMELTDADEDTAVNYLDKNDWNIKKAISAFQER